MYSALFISVNDTSAFDLANLHEFISTLTEKDSYKSLRDCRNEASRTIIHAFVYGIIYDKIKAASGQISFISKIFKCFHVYELRQLRQYQPIVTHVMSDHVFSFSVVCSGISSVI